MKTSLEIYLAEIDKTQLLTREQEVELHAKVKAGDEVAKAKFIESNLRLVVTIAGDFTNLGVEIEDLISEGNIGLMLAVDRFDASRGVKFSAYARFWIRHKMYRSLASQSRLIRLPTHILEYIRKLNRFTEEYSVQNGEEPDDEWLAEQLDVEFDEVANLREYRDRKEIALEGYFWKSPPDRTVEGKVDKKPEKVLIPNESLDPSEELNEQQEIGRMISAIATLTPREQFVLSHRFPLDGSEPMSLGKLGRDPKLNMTREGVRHIQVEALSKLKHTLQYRDGIIRDR